MWYFLDTSYFLTSILRRDTEKRKQEHGLYTEVIYIGIKANGYRILTTTSIIQNFAFSAKLSE